MIWIGIVITGVLLYAYNEASLARKPKNSEIAKTILLNLPVYQKMLEDKR